MSPMTPSQLTDAIQWDFTISNQQFYARYGTLNFQRYRQYMPNGNIFPDQYPPKPIADKQYQIALANYNLHK